MAAARVTADPVDAVFSSEPYGPELARRFEARHVPVDPARALAPVSGTRIRADPVATWNYVEPPVRGWLARRIVIVGAESTGKTTFAADLTEALRARGAALGLTRWVPEYGREHTIRLLARARAHAVLNERPAPELQDLSWPSEDFVAIAAEQNAREDEAARCGGPVLVCDTDAFATSVWHERYVGSRSTAVDALGRVHPLYLLTHPADVPFDQDGLRDGQHLRDWMTGLFEERLRSTGRRWTWIRGSRQERMKAALASIDAVLAEGWGLAPPLG